MNTMMQGWVRAAAMGALLCIGVMAAPQVLAHDTPQPIAVTEGGSGVVAVSAGYYHSCGLKADGSVDCWGGNGFDYGQAADQAGPYVSVAVGYYHSCGLKADGSVDCWGYDAYGQAADPAGPYVSVSAGYFHNCGLKADGSVDCWGYDAYGQAADQAGPFVSVSAGYFHNCGLKADGSVDCWGNNDYGQAADQAGPFVSVSAGYFHNCGLKADGSVDCWGFNSYGQAADQAGPYVSVSAGEYHTCGLKADGSVDCWGDNSYGHAADQAGPYVSVSAGHFHTCGVKADGSVQCWGAGGEGTSGYPNYGQATVPAGMSAVGSAGFGQIAAGNAHACQVTREGTLSCWGDNSVGQTVAPSGLFTQVVAGDAHSCAIGTGGTVTCWGREAPENTSAFSGSRWRQLAPGLTGGLCGIPVDGARAAYCYRLNDVGSSWPISAAFSSISNQDGSVCGVSLNPDYQGNGYCLVPGWPLPGPWRRIESGLDHECGLKADGSLECWGSNAVGQFGAPLVGKFRALSTGWNHACAIRDNGELYCWGSNVSGQTNAPSGTFVQVAAGNTFTCGIRSNGTRVCWGSDTTGQAPQLALSPGLLPLGLVGTAYQTTQFVVADAAPDADGDYVPPTPAFAVVGGSLPDSVTLSPNGALSGTPTADGSFSFTVEAEDANGFTASREYSINVIMDNTGPEITYTLTPPTPDGENDWYVSDVGVSWTVTDAESAITSSTGCNATTLASDTLGATFTCSGASAGGSSEVTTASIKRDATAPTITAAATTAPNANGWYSGGVTIHFSCSDATSGLAGSCPADVVLTASASSATPTIFDNAGNSATSNAVTVQIDKSAPAVSYVFAPPAPDGNNGWYRGNVGIDWTIGDAESGIASSNGCTDSTLSSDTAGASWTCTVTNNADLQTSVTTATIKRDGTGPTLNPTVPDPLLRGQSYSASTNAVDVLSGLASASCGALDTSSTGSKSTSCTANDNAGNSNTVTLNYTVSTTCANEGYKSTQLTWCQSICESGLSGQSLDTWIHRWINRYRDLPYCRAGAE